jgi:uncharacterized membrane protein YcfT
VVLHATEWLGFIWTLPTAVTEVNEALASVRMPLFFFIAGSLGAKWRGRSYKSLFNGRLAILLWTFVLWQPVIFAYKYAAGRILPGQNADSLSDHLLRLAVTLVRPNGELWFLWALIVFFLIARATRRVDDRVQVVFAGAVSAVWFGVARPNLGSSALRQLGDGWDGLFSLYFFFLLGVVFGGTLISKVGRWRIPWLFLIVGGWIVVEVVGHYLDTNMLSNPYNLLERIVGLFAGVSMARLLSRTRWLAYIGKRTLPIYLGHSAVIVAVVCAIYMAFGLVTEEHLWVDLACIISIAIVAVCMSLFLYRARNVSSIGWIYDPPVWFRLNEAFPQQSRESKGSRHAI